MAFEHTLSIENSSERPLVLVLEPWGMPLELALGQHVEVTGRATQAGHLHLEHRVDALVVWGWPSSTVEVRGQSGVLFSCSVPVPGVPPGRTVAGFLKGVLGLK